MSALYPGALPVAGTASSTATLVAAGHTALHNNDRDEIRAVATKIGTGSSTPTASTVLRGTGAGTSAWGQVVLTTDVTGTLPVANGGTGTTSTTGSGSVVYSDSPTLVTPTIASLVNAQHTHQNAAGGGVLVAAAMPNLSTLTQTISNPYKFSAYHGTTQTLGTSETKVLFDTEEWDSGGNFAANTYTAPVDGYYLFFSATSWTSTASQTRATMTFYKNGGAFHKVADIITNALATGVWGSVLMKLTAGETVDVYVTSVGASATARAGQTNTWFSGILISHT